jgi:hypothetical protein
MVPQENRVSCKYPLMQKPLMTGLARFFLAQSGKNVPM